MAIYHCSAHNVSRSSGRTATASIAYRAGEKIHDQRTGLTHDYTKRARHQEIAHTQIISNLGAKIDRSELWNLAEMRENRKDARTAKEFVIALPHELDYLSTQIEKAQNLQRLQTSNCDKRLCVKVIESKCNYGSKGDRYCVAELK